MASSIQAALAFAFIPESKLVANPSRHSPPRSEAIARQLVRHDVND